MPNTNILGLFDRYQDAERAMNELLVRGWEHSDIGVLLREDVAQGAVRPAASQAQRPPQPARPDLEFGLASASGGAAVGGLAGLLVGLGALTIPGIGPVVAAGTLFSALGSTLAGTAIGAATGGWITGTLGLDVPAEQARSFEAGVQRGGVLVTVRVGDDARAAQVQDILRDANAIEVGAAPDSAKAGAAKAGGG